MTNNIPARQYAEALRTLAEGGSLLYPTDTIWGIGCDATRSEAVEKLYAIKNRDHSKALLILATEAMLTPDLPPVVKGLLLHSGRPTTVVLSARYVAVPLAANLLAADGTVGVRIPRMDFCQALLQGFGRPIVSTSANFSGQPSPAAFSDISPLLRQRVDCCLDDHPSFHHAPVASSRIVRLTPDGQVETLRP